MNEVQWALTFAALSGVGAVVSAVIAILAKGDSRTAADASARSADAAEISASAGREAVAEARRANDLVEARERAIRNERVSQALTIDPDTGRRFWLVNNGDLAVFGVEFVNPPQTLTDVPQHFDLPARGKSDPFVLTGGAETERPDFVYVRWDGLAEPVLVEFPYDALMSIY